MPTANEPEAKVAVKSPPTARRRRLPCVHAAAWKAASPHHAGDIVTVVAVEPLKGQSQGPADVNTTWKKALPVFKSCCPLY